MRTRSSRRLMMIQKPQKSKDCNSNNNNNNNNDNNPIIHQVDFSEDHKPHFFKIIVSPLEQKLHLRIPEEFVMKHGMHITDDVWLTVPKSKQPWKVELEKDGNDNLFLGKGWQDFMNFYNLDYGHLLVFRLDRGPQTHFSVLIFNATAAEIDYSVGGSGSSEATRSTNSQQLISVDNNISEDDDVIIVGEDSPRSPLHNETVKSVVKLDDHRLNSNKAKSSGNKRTGYVISNDTKEKLLRKLDEFKPSSPHFKVVLFPSYVQNRYRMNVSLSHTAHQFVEKSKEIIMLIGPNGQKYHATFSIGRGRGEIYSAGWKNLVLDNQLKTGDACLFELIDPRSHSYKVTVLRRDVASR